MADPSFPIEKITISSTTLSAILHRLSSSSGDISGLLFGHLSPLPPPSPLDDNPSSSPANPTPLFSASITSHFSSSSPFPFYDPLGCIHPISLLRAISPARLPSLLGLFSARRRSPLRPSMRDLALSHSLHQTLNSDQNPKPCIFLLFSFSSTENQAIHTHEWRAFCFLRGSLEPRPLHVVNIGPDFRGQYGSFAPGSEIPLVGLGGEGGLGEEELVAARALLDSVAEGFGVERLEELVGLGVERQVLGLEELYGRMLRRLEGLARSVEMSNARVVEQVVLI